jgi:hypothetical protein
VFAGLAAIHSKIRAVLLLKRRRLAVRRADVMAVMLFLFLAMASTWPLVRAMRDHLPLGTEGAATVPLFNVWSIWWNADRAADGYDNYWDAPIFYPAGRTFAYSEPMPLMVLAAPVVWLTGNRVLAYNCLLLLALWFNGWMTYHLLRQLHFRRIIAALGGAMMELLPLVHAFLGVLQLVPLFGILFTLLAMYRWGRRPSVFGAIQFGLALAITYLMCAYYGLFLLLPLLLSAPWLIAKGRWRVRMLWKMVPGAFLCALLILPFALAQKQTITENNFIRSEAYLKELSASFADYLAPPWPPLIEIKALRAFSSDAVFRLNPGLVKLSLALIGIAAGLGSRRRRPLTLFCLTLAASSFALSFGPLLQIAGFKPYLLLVDHVPGFAQARNVFRFAVFVQVMVPLLAVVGLEAGWSGMRSARLHCLFRSTVIAAGLLGIIEILPPAQPLFQVPAYSANRGWLEWLKTQTPTDSIVACIPFSYLPTEASYEQETIWMYWQTFHHRKMLNGYSGFFPATFQSLKMPMAEFPTRLTIDRLCNMGVNCCVVKRDSVYGADAREYQPYDPRLKLAFSDDAARIDIYRLTRQ